MRFTTKQGLTGLARALGGALLFAFPIVMTMESWWLGFYLERYRIALFIAVSVAFVVFLNHVSGFRSSPRRWQEDLIDAGEAYAVGFVLSLVLLWLFGVIAPGMPADRVLGQVGLLMVPCAFGAVIASKQLGEPAESNEDRKDEQRISYWEELAVILAGALYGAFTVSPTEEMLLIAYMATPWLLLGLVVLSILLMHGFVYGMSFKGQAAAKGSFLSLFVRFTVTGYALALLMSTYVLWTFGRLEGLDPGIALQVIVVSAFPAAIGAAASRLVL